MAPEVAALGPGGPPRGPQGAPTAGAPQEALSGAPQGAPHSKAPIGAPQGAPIRGNPEGAPKTGAPEGAPKTEAPEGAPCTPEAVEEAPCIKSAAGGSGGPSGGPPIEGFSLGPPESKAAGEGYLGAPVDWWGLGVLLYECLAG